MLKKVLEMERKSQILVKGTSAKVMFLKWIRRANLRVQNLMIVVKANYSPFMILEEMMLRQRL